MIGCRWRWSLQRVPRPPGALALSVEDAIKATLRASASVTLLPAASMPRTGGKTKRLIRED